MRALLNDILRALLALTIRGWGHALECAHLSLVARFARQQRGLRQRYGITDTTPVSPWGDVVQRAIAERARSYRGRVLWACTSGSTQRPKRLFYTRARVLRTQWQFATTFARLFARWRVRRTSMFVFSASREQNSLTSLLVREATMPSRLALLQAPYRILGHPQALKLADTFGDTALRLFVLVLANPGVIYATNPSTLVAFFRDLENDWPRAVGLVRAYGDGTLAQNEWLQCVYHRLVSRGAASRLHAVAQASQCPPVHQLLPHLAAFACWDGGYVRGFIETLRSWLPEGAYRHIPMYSMSTETIETVAEVDGSTVRFLPMAPGVYYEFIEEGESDAPANLLASCALQSGRAYTMVVSDAYGLRRYQTEDVFLCRGHHCGLPDLHFARRRGLAFSFTGEKLTGEHLRQVFAYVKNEGDLGVEDAFLACIPSRPCTAESPHYRIAVVRSGDGLSVAQQLLLCARVDALLGTINPEYRVKRDSKRLGPLRCEMFDVASFAHCVGGNGRAWESQFKFLPLYPKLWEEMVDAGARAAS